MKYKYPLILMFQPISHCCSCLLLAETGPENHLFYLSRCFTLEMRQKALGGKKAQGQGNFAKAIVLYNATEMT